MHLSGYILVSLAALCLAPPHWHRNNPSKLRISNIELTDFKNRVIFTHLQVILIFLNLIMHLQMKLINRG